VVTMQSIGHVQKSHDDFAARFDDKHLALDICKQLRSRYFRL